MNVQHSSRSDSWQTPENIITRVHLVLGVVDLDPASDASANRRVGATRFITREENALSDDCEWPAGSVFLNPPGGKRANGSLTGHFWKRLMDFRDAGKLTHGIFMAFSLEALAVSQGYGSRSIGTFPLCVPRKRIAFLKPDGSVGEAPSHANCIAYLPGSVDETARFAEVFADLGVIMNVGVRCP